jgi:hypothetical protein
VKPPFDWIDEGKASRQAEDDSEEDVQIWQGHFEFFFLFLD